MHDDAPGFFRHMRLRLEEEVKRAKMMLPVGSWNLVRKVTEQALWTNRIDWLANESKCLRHRQRGNWLNPRTAVSIYMERGDIEMLGSMYTLFARVGGVKVLCASFKKCIQVRSFCSRFIRCLSSRLDLRNGNRERSGAG